MPRPRTPAGYPSIFPQIIEAVTSGGEEFHHRCEDNKKAQLLRFTMYDYIKCCRRSHEQRYKILAEQAAGLIFSIKGDYLIVKLRDMEDTALALTDSLMKYQAGKAPMAMAPEVSKQQISPSELPPRKGPSQDDLIGDFLSEGKKK